MPRAVAAVGIDVKQNAYDEARGRVFYRQLLDAVRADAGVESATLAAYHAARPARYARAARGDRGLRTRAAAKILPSCRTRSRPDYFRTLRIACVAGRRVRGSTTMRRRRRS